MSYFFISFRIVICFIGHVLETSTTYRIMIAAIPTNPIIIARFTKVLTMFLRASNVDFNRGYVSFFAV